jgi:tripartite-type tricarboxylate transporter receptor subunit TctC
MTMRILSVAVIVAIMGAVGCANAETYPSRPITMLVGYAVGGPSDTIARIMADRMRVSLGQPVIVENVTGAAPARWRWNAARGRRPTAIRW